MFFFCAGGMLDGIFTRLKSNGGGGTDKNAVSRNALSYVAALHIHNKENNNFIPRNLLKMIGRLSYGPKDISVTSGRRVQIAMKSKNSDRILFWRPHAEVSRLVDERVGGKHPDRMYRMRCACVCVFHTF
jgi:hypothetical protein